MLTLHEIRDQYNALVPTAQQMGYRVKPWVGLPADRDHGMHRLNWIRNKCGLPSIGNEEELRSNIGASLPLAYIRNEWNRLVPEATSRGINVRAWAGVPPTTRHGMRRLIWLRDRLSSSTSSTPISVAINPGSVADFDGMTFGVEIECYLPGGLSSYELAQALTNAGVPTSAEVYNHQVRSNWKIVTDASLGSYNGIEIVSPVLSGPAGFEALRRVCRVIVEKRLKVSRKAGLHVHVGVRSETCQTLNRLALRYSYFQSVISGFLAPSRATNQFAMPFRNVVGRSCSTWADVQRACGQTPGTRDATRYRVVNFQALDKYGTVEFRQHQGTTEWAKIEPWVKFCLRMVISARTHSTPAAPASLDLLCDSCGMSDEEKSYFAARTRAFAPTRPTMPIGAAPLAHHSRID